MIRRQEAARAAALFLSFAAFFMTCPLTLWDAALFAQISIDRAVEVLAINGLMATSAVLAVGMGAVVDGPRLRAHDARCDGAGRSGLCLGRVGLCARAGACPAGRLGWHLRYQRRYGFWISDARAWLVSRLLSVWAETLTSGHEHRMRDGRRHSPSLASKPVFCQRAKGHSPYFCGSVSPVRFGAPARRVRGNPRR